MRSLWEKSIALPAGSSVYGAAPSMGNSTINFNQKTAALLCGACTLLILVAFQPPFVQSSGKNPMDEGHLSPMRCVLSSVMVSGIAFAVVKK